MQSIPKYTTKQNLYAPCSWPPAFASCDGSSHKHQWQSHLLYSFLYPAEIMLTLQSVFGGRKDHPWLARGVKPEQEVRNPMLCTSAASDRLHLTCLSLPGKLQFRVYMELGEGNKTWSLA